MSSPDANRRDDLLIRLMADYDEALEAGAPAPPIDESVVDSEPQLAADWQVEKAWLDALHQARQIIPLEAGNSKPTASHTRPHQIGRFTIERELGRGGLGIVYLARDPQLGRSVALKVPRADSLLDHEMRPRFLREAEAAARLNHPNVATLLEVGEDDGLCYLASEYCPGPTLAEWLEARYDRVAPRDAAVLMLALTEAVQHAHSRGVLHRDIKPSNVLMAESAGDAPVAVWSPKLTDFGLAKLLEQTSDDRTRTGIILGTPAYMAPEQVEGRVNELDNRTDVYGLGAVLYELLAGVAPYRGQTEIDTLRQLIATEPVPPRKLRPDIPRDLEAIALKCLAKNPAHRYQTAVGLAQDLRRYLAGEPTVARPPGWAERTMKWSRRHPAASAAALIAMIALGVLSVGGWVTTARTRSALALAEERRVRAEESEAAVARSELASRRLLYTSEVARAATAWEANEPTLARELLAHWIPRQGEGDLREFAWHHLWAKTHEEERILTGHTSDVLCVRYSADGKLLASASKDHSVRLWNAETGALAATLVGHTDEVNSLCFLSDQQLLSAGNDGRLLLWDTTAHKLAREVVNVAHHLYSVVASPDRRIVALGGVMRNVQLFRTEDWTPLAPITGPWDYVRAVQFSADGSTLFTASDDGPIRVWQISSPRLLGVLKGHPSCVRALALFDHDRGLVSAGREDGTLRIWNLPKWEDERTLTVEPVRALPPHPAWLHDVAVAPQTKLAVVAGRNGAIRQVNLETGNVERTFDGHEGRVWSICFSPDGQHIATAGEDQTIRIWNAHGDRSHTPYQIPNAILAALRFDHAGTPIAIHSGWRNGLAINLQDNSHPAELASPHFFERDFDGDGHADACEYVDGVWTIRFANGATRTFSIGSPVDEPLVGDWNGDGKCDVALYRDQVFRLYCNLDKLEPSVPTRTVAITELPQRVVAGDWDHDGTDEIGYFTAQGLQLDEKLSGGGPEWRQARAGAPLERIPDDGCYPASDLFDLAFGQRGAIGQAVPHTQLMPHRCLLLADGKIITAGQRISEKDGVALFVARFDKDGRLDESFGQGGFSVQPGDLDANGISVLADGKLVVSGNWNSPQGVPFGAVWRFQPDGRLDATFKGAPLGGYASLAVQPDGKLLLAGAAYLPEHRQCLAVFRLLGATGEPDTTFGTGGRVIPLAGSSGAWHMALQPDGKILAAGFQKGGDRVQSVVVRLLPTGELDKSFGVDGVTLVYPELSYCVANRLLVLPDGKILVNSATKENDATSFALVRLTADGRIDSSFGSSGRAPVPPLPAISPSRKGPVDLSCALALGPHGTIVAGGHVDYGISIATYDGNGNLRGEPGSPKLIASGGIGGIVCDIAVDPAGRVLALAQNVAPSNACLYRLLPHPRVLDNAAAYNATWQKTSPAETETVACAVAQAADLWAVGFRQLGIVRCGHLDQTGPTRTVGPIRFTLGPIALSDDGQRLAATSDRGALEIWDVATNSRLARIDGGNGPMGSPMFSPDGQLVAYCEQPGRIMLWDFAHSAPRSVDQTAMEDCDALCFSPDGRRLATGNTDRGIKLWDVATGIQIGRLAGQKSRVWALAFSPDGRTLASGGNDSNVTLWDLVTNQKLCELHRHWAGIHALRFRSDGKALVASGGPEVDVWSTEDRAVAEK